jgi:hypothetical protein
MANQHTKAKAMKAKRSDAAKRAWITIRANRAAQAENKEANKGINAATIQKAVKVSERKLAA